MSKQTENYEIPDPAEVGRELFEPARSNGWGTTRPYGPTKRTRGKIRAVRAAFQAGYTVPEIARAMGLTENRIYQLYSMRGELRE